MIKFSGFLVYNHKSFRLQRLGAIKPVYDAIHCEERYWDEGKQNTCS